MNFEKKNMKEFLEMPPVGNISTENSKSIVGLLNSILANEYLIFTKTLNFHWNFKGPRFTSMHDFLGKHYTSLLEVMDEIAERVKMVGGQPVSTAKEMTQVTTLEERPGAQLSSNEMISTLIKDHHIIQEMISYGLKANEKALHEDKGTEDMLVGMLRIHEKMNWMLKSSLI